VYNAHDDEGTLLDDVYLQHVSRDHPPLPHGGLTKQEVHNINTAMSYNALSACAALGIHRVVLASSVNAIGMSEYLRRPVWAGIRTRLT
jgi:nucleoside-diphosphate-sugar epimerase